jgi:hypothetical protein
MLKKILAAAGAAMAISAAVNFVIKHNPPD